MQEMDTATQATWSSVVSKFRGRGTFNFSADDIYPYGFEEHGGRTRIACTTVETLRHELAKRYNQWEKPVNGDSS